jgi:hypothetical protein
VRDELRGVFASITRTGLEASARYVVRSEAVTADEIAAQLRAAHPKDLATGSPVRGPGLCAAEGVL